MDLYNELIETIRREQVILFIGSGFSLDAGAPSSSKIIGALKKEMDEQTKKSVRGNFDLQFVSNEFLQMSSREKLIEVLQKCFRFKKKQSLDHELLYTIPYFDEIYTTNYDTLLEDLYGDKCCVIRTDEDFAIKYQSKGFPKIFKVHGDFTVSDNMIITEKDYTNFYQSQKNPYIWRHLEEQCLTKNILFIGYSLEDDNVTYIVERIRKVNKQNKIFLIAPNFHERKIRRLNNLGIEYVDSSATPFLTCLKENIENNIISDSKRGLVSIDKFNRVCQIHDCSPQVTLSDNGFILNQFMPIIGKPYKKTLNFQIDETELLKIQYRLVEDFGSLNIKSPRKCFVIPHELCKKIDVKINELRILSRDDIQNLYLFPQNKKRIIQIKSDTYLGVSRIVVESRHIDEEAIFIVKKTKSEEIFLYNFEAYSLKIVRSFHKNDSNLDFQIHIECKFNNEFTDIKKAIMWMGLLEAFDKNERYSIENVVDSKFLTDKLEPNDNMTLQPIIEYYRRTQELEQILKRTFEKYENYSPQNLDCTYILLCFYLKKMYKTKRYFSENISLTYPRSFPRADIEYIKGNRRQKILFERNMNTINIHGEKFIIPYCSQLIEDATLNIEEKADAVIIHVKNHDKIAMLFFSSEPIPFEKVGDYHIKQGCINQIEI